MNIEIKDQLRPFSHLPGTFFMVPRSSWQVQVFPTKLIFQDLSDTSAKCFEVDLELTGPHRDFTVQQYLEEGFVRIFSHTAKGYVRYRIQAQDNAIQIHCEKTFADVAVSIANVQEALRARKIIQLPFVAESTTTKTLEKLSFGAHKLLDWDLVCRRKLLEEILPVWFCVAQQAPKFPDYKPEGTLALLKHCEEMIANKSRVGLYDAWINLFTSSFEGVLVPRCEDPYFWGITSKVVTQFSPLALLHHACSAIRSMFFQESGDTVTFLPCLPPEFHAGHMTGIVTKDGDVIDFEWSKKMLRKVVWKAGKTRKVTLNFPADIASFRTYLHPRDKGQKIEKEKTILVQKDTVLYFDRFQK